MGTLWSLEGFPERRTDCLELREGVALEWRLLIPRLLDG